ncbi:alpha/beta-hydrolase [Dendrothele bispora CBS 962.96]|uniref:Alpha/beta-hydrolase n=1 Tax=Dendrothele bispora (strain CBS 962.96) TaxID=1314807 RepID=A0A4V4HI03_DENBC|nr:alpha/beta-hydrolase [Dendrothele bispora CBS 962.96]
MYASEKFTNFRWIAKILATYSPCTLTSADLASETLDLELAEIGQFTELANTTLSIEFILKNIHVLSGKDYPLEGYDILRESELISDFTGKVAHLHGFVAWRPKTKQLIVSTSGTRTALQALYDLRAFMHRHPSKRGGVHQGFWKLYKGVRPFILEGLRKGFLEHEEVSELVVTGHSMGGAVSYLLSLDLLSTPDVVPNIPIKLVVFGAPRPGDQKLAKYWQEVVRDFRKRNNDDRFFQEYSVKAYNDGVPALPPLSLGFRHFTQEPLYFVHGKLYCVPASESEHTLFHVEDDNASGPPEHPRGGHNYYNKRDQEKTIRRMDWLDETLGKGPTDKWEELYNKKWNRNTT